MKVGLIESPDGKRIGLKVYDEDDNQQFKSDAECNGNCNFIDDGRIEADPACPIHGCAA